MATKKIYIIPETSEERDDRDYFLEYDSENQKFSAYSHPLDDADVLHEQFAKGGQYYVQRFEVSGGELWFTNNLEWSSDQVSVSRRLVSYMCGWGHTLLCKDLKRQLADIHQKMVDRHSAEFEVKRNPAQVLATELNHFHSVVLLKVKWDEEDEMNFTDCQNGCTDET